jgi:hypothetical protein
VLGLPTRHQFPGQIGVHGLDAGVHLAVEGAERAVAQSGLRGGPPRLVRALAEGGGQGGFDDLG